jgi:hypothetical protein
MYLAAERTGAEIAMAYLLVLSRYLYRGTDMKPKPTALLTAFFGTLVIAQIAKKFPIFKVFKWVRPRSHERLPMGSI